MKDKILDFLYEWAVPIISGIVGGVIGTILVHIVLRS